MASNETPKYKLSVTEGTELQLSLNGPTGPTGPANVLNIGTVTTAETDVPAFASITGSSPTQLLHLTLPKGNTGTAATIAVGSTSTGAAGTSASVTNSGSSSAAVFNFTIPKGDKGNTGTLSLGTVATGNAGTEVIITNTGTPEAGQFNFTIPRGNTGATGPTGPATQLSVNSTVTGEAGTNASVAISGTAPSQTLTFTIPRGNTGATGPPTELYVNPTITGEAGTNASVVISGTAPSQTLTFTIPRGNTGATGSSGAVSLLTGFASAAGTVAATDTVLAAVGKLDGNIALRATTASLYPYIGGKLLTYADEEAAIADPLISGGDLYRKTAGGVDYVNPDNVPSLDLQFATDKTLTARRGPTPVLTRASGATYVGSDGLIHGVDTSTTSNTIGTGSKTFTLAATAGQDQLYRTGDAVDASNGSNSMVGTVTSYDASTQVLVCNITSVTGSGTFTSWRIGYRGPRFDHNPVSPFACRGLLIEEGRENFISFSEAFSDASWGKASTGIAAPVVTANQGTSPDGQNTADRIVFAASTATGQEGHVWKVAGGGTKAAGSSVTASVWLRTETGTATVYLSITEGAIGGTYTACSVTTTWTRFTVTRTLSTTAFVYMEIGPDTRASGANQPTAAGATALVWGAQLEAGAFPTSYIPTTTSTLARSADVCNITGGAFNSFYNQSEGTLYAHVSGLMNNTLSGARPFVAISDGTYQNQIGIFKSPSTGFLSASGTVSNLNQFNFSSAYSPSTQYKVALGFKTNDANAAFNGTLGTTGTSVTMPSTVNRMEFRDGTGAAGGQPTGHIAAVRYYKKRLPNAKLQALTA